MSKQTSIEWLFEKIKHIIPNDDYYYSKFEQAKQMHKQEIVNTFNSADSLHYFGQDIDKDGHDYYDEIYGGNNG